MPMKNPPDPGGFVLRQCIEPLGLTITQAAAALRVTRTTLSELVKRETRNLSRNDGTPVQSLRWQRRHLANPTGPLRPGPSPRRPHQAQTPAIRLASAAGAPDPLSFRTGPPSPAGNSLWKPEGPVSNHLDSHKPQEYVSSSPEVTPRRVPRIAACQEDAI